MTFRLLFLLVCLIPQIGFSQLTDKDAEVLRQDLSEQINNLRVGLGLQPLIFNDTLKRAAQFHSDYMALHDLLTHDETQPKYATPKKRVTAFEGTDFETVGENALYSTAQSFPLKSKGVHKLADEMFNSWLNSPGHYANMTEPEYVYGDLGFKTNIGKRIVYATQVFGTKGYRVPGQLSSNAFGLSETIKDCEREFGLYSNVILNMGNGLSIEGDQVTLYFHDLSYFKQKLSGPNDGIAVDLVSRDQLLCGQPNQMDFSPVYDGILLKPYFTPAILANNRAESEYRIIAKIADIPDALQGNTYSPSLLLIKNGKVCKYVYPALIPYKGYALRTIEPIIQDEPSVQLVKQGVVRSQIVHYDFRTGSTSAIQIPTIQEYDNEIHSIQINSYSSVEGDQNRNTELHTSRAAFIQEQVSGTLAASPDTFIIHAEENWEQMNFQLNYFEREDLTRISHDSLKTIIAHRDNSLPWDSMLLAQRRATVVINYLGEFAEDGSEGSIGAFNLRTAVATGNSRLANKALFEMHRSSDHDPHILFEPQVLEFVKAQPTVIANYAAVVSFNFASDPYLVTTFIHSCLNQADKLDDRARFNLNHLYTLVGSYLLDNWDVSAERLSNVIHPKKMALISSKNETPELVLNLNLTFIQYYGQVNDAANISRAFNHIADHFKKISLKPEDDVDLALFFNSWSRYDLTLDYLLPRFKKGSLNEEGLFVLAQTMNFTSYTADQAVYVDVLEKALQSDPTRWCRWINSDFQIKRHFQIKRLYCESCQ